MGPPCPFLPSFLPLILSLTLQCKVKDLSVTFTGFVSLCFSISLYFLFVSLSFSSGLLCTPWVCHHPPSSHSGCEAQLASLCSRKHLAETPGGKWEASTGEIINLNLSSGFQKLTQWWHREEKCVWLVFNCNISHGEENRGWTKGEIAAEYPV